MSDSLGSTNDRRLTIYLDCVSPYSWFGFTNAIRYRPLLNYNNVSVEIVPFFLGAAREAAGNPFAPTPKAKEAFGKQDTATTGRLLGLNVVQPKEFPILSLFPIRVVTWIKDHSSAEKFEAAFEALASGYWGKGINVSKPEGVIESLNGIFTIEEVKDIMMRAMTPENKTRVLEMTKSSGAFGAPWIRAINGEGKRKEWFGNDRWDQVFDHLGVPFAPVTILPPESAKAKL